VKGNDGDERVSIFRAVLWFSFFPQPQHFLRKSNITRPISFQSSKTLTSPFPTPIRNLSVSQPISLLPLPRLTPTEVPHQVLQPLDYPTSRSMSIMVILSSRSSSILRRRTSWGSGRRVEVSCSSSTRDLVVERDAARFDEGVIRSAPRGVDVAGSA